MRQVSAPPPALCPGVSGAASPVPVLGPVVPVPRGAFQTKVTRKVNVSPGFHLENIGKMINIGIRPDFWAKLAKHEHFINKNFKFKHHSLTKLGFISKHRDSLSMGSFIIGRWFLHRCFAVRF